MKKSLVSAVALVAMAASAHAADFAPYDEQTVFTSNLFDWNGFYLGANAGYLWGKSDVSGFGSTSARYSKNGFIGGGQAGFNYQTGSWVWGGEVDIQYSGADGSTLTGCPVGGSCSTSLDWFGTVRGRAGYAYDRALVYLTGGLAYGGTKTADTGVGSFSKSKTGWTLGGGVEYGFRSHWTAKAEYLYMDLGSASGGGLTGDYNRNHMLRVGVNYLFN